MKGPVGPEPYEELAKLQHLDGGPSSFGFKSITLPTLYEVREGGPGLQRAMDRLRRAVSEAVAAGNDIVILSDRGIDHDHAAIPALLAVAEYTTKLHAVCIQCGAPACRSQRIVDSQEQVVVGADSAYEARCRKCWSPEPVFTQWENRHGLEG